MARIRAADDVKVFSLQRFLGLNESPDGDTQIKMGESPEMRNWRITGQGHLSVRPGYAEIQKFSGPVRGLWRGFVGGQAQTICVADGAVWVLSGSELRRIGDIWDADTSVFGFAGKVYFLNGHEYLVWDGEGFVDAVDGYVPLVTAAAAPGGGGTQVEPVNRLTGKRRCRFSADGKATEYHLPEAQLLSVDKVVIGTEQAYGWTADTVTGVVTFGDAPAAGNSNVEIWYTAPNTLRSLVEGMRYAEQFNGAADTRVFLYGDGSAKAIYCGVTEDGQASAEYFPDLYEILIGSENAPLTGMIKYYDRLMSYKADGGAFSTSYEVTTLADGSMIPGFKTVSVNREIGNDAPGQVRLVQNIPRTIFGGNLYAWTYINYATRDERNAKLLSQRVQNSLSGADPRRVFCFDDDSEQEYYLFLNDSRGTVLVNNYELDVWFLYTGLPAAAACRTERGLLLGMTDRRLVLMSDELPNDAGKAIDAFWASGHMSFERDWQRKTSSEVWVSVQPTASANLMVTARSDRRGDYTDKAISMPLTTFRNFDFGRMSFITTRSPQMERLKLKVKKFVYYQLILKSNYVASDATVLAVDFKVRYTGNVK